MYVSIAPNGTAMISTKPPVDEFYIEVDVLPEGDGPLMLSADGTLYRLSAQNDTPIPAPDAEPSVWDELDAAYQEGVDSV